MVAGYHRAFPLEEAEIALLYALVGTRLAVSVTNSALAKRRKPDDPYVTISEAPAWEALKRLAEVHPRLAHVTFREACGLPPVPVSSEIRSWLSGQSDEAASQDAIACPSRPASKCRLPCRYLSRPRLLHRSSSSG